MPIATELDIVRTSDASLVAETIFGPGITIVSSTLTGSAGQTGVYSNGKTTSPGVAPSESGVVFSTGNVADFTNSSGTTDTNTQDATSTEYNGPGDAQLTAIAGVETFDSIVFEAVFIPDNDFMTMQFVFSSEEYLEFVNDGFNDVIGVWVNGALVELTPTGDTVSIDTVNTTVNSNLYVDNPDSQDLYNTEMDGFTITMAFKAPVIAGVENSIKIGLADGGDAEYDSNFLIAANSLQTVAIAFSDQIELTPNSPAILDVLANDSDSSGLGLTITKINNVDVTPGDTVAFGTGEEITLNADGTLTVLTDGDLTASTFTYEVTDGLGITDVGYVTVTTAAIPDPDGIVDGTTGSDLIDTEYLGDPQGDRVDNADSLGVQGTTGDGDVINGFQGNDTIRAGAGDDIVDGGADNDVIDGGAGNDTLIGGNGDDTLFGGDGNDSLFGGDGNDSLYGEAGNDRLEAGGGTNQLVDGGEGDDSLFNGGGDGTAIGGDGDDYIYADSGNDQLFGDSGDDTFDLDDTWGSFGNDTIIGGETGETTGDTLDLSGVSLGTTLDLTNADPEAGTVSDGISTAAFSEIETIVLSGGRDTILLADGSGSDTVSGFNMTDSGDGTTTDQLDVSGVTDAGGAIVNTGDVVVTDTNGDGSGDAILTFPGGESLTLLGVSPAQLSTPAQLAAIGIPEPDFIVEGTAGADLINTGYTDDPEGDIVDGGDAADGSENDVIEAGDGNDTVFAGLGDDSVLGGEGDDSLSGQEGNDTIFGGGGNDSIRGNVGDDFLDGGDGNDTIAGGSDADTIVGGLGDDYLIGGIDISGGDGNDTIDVFGSNAVVTGDAGDDLIRLLNNPGTTTVTGGEAAEVTGDTLDMSAATNSLIIDLSNPDPESGTVTDGSEVLTFSEIENLILGGGADTIVLADGAGRNSVSGFNMTDSGDARTIDQLDVSGVADAGGAIVNTGDVVVTDTNGDGTGDAILTFPSGESLTLLGVSPAQLSTPAQLAAIGIPEPDFIVEGTASADLIDTGYTGDPEGDRVDALDSASGTNDDVIDAGAGNDTVVAGLGDDLVYGSTGNDSLLGGDGNDLLDGGNDDDTLDGWAGNDTLTGGLGNDLLTGSDGTDIFVYVAGDGVDTITDFNFGNTGTLNDADTTNNDRLDLSAFYDDIWELTADFNDDGILNQSNDGLGGADYSDNASFGSGGLVILGATGDKTSFTVENTGVVCFTSGTRILTTDGDRRIDTLRAGDRIVTRDNGVQTLRWIGQRQLDAADLARVPKLRPILLSPALTGGDAPLIVSPQHGVLFTLDGEETLVRATHLARMQGGTARVMHGCRSVTYFHLLFEDHQIVFANGAPSESFFPGAFAMAALHSEVRHEIFALFPDLRIQDAATAYGRQARDIARLGRLPDHLKALKARPHQRIVASAGIVARARTAGAVSLHKAAS